MRTGRGALPAAFILLLSAATPVLAQNSPAYEVVSRDQNELELRFHGVPLKGVHADDSQNALSMDFQTPVDGAVFDRLASDQPGWIAMSYANYDNGVIRATRPVTFLTRRESDGFSLRIVPRGPVAGGPPAYGPPASVALRGPDYGPPPGYGPPPPPYGAPAAYGPAPAAPFARGDKYAAARNYYGLQLAVNRNDPATLRAYEDAGSVTDSGASLGSEYKHWRNGDQVVATNLKGSLAMSEGLSVMASLDDYDLRSDQVRLPGGTFGAGSRNILTGSAGFGIDDGDGGTGRALVLGGNGMVGGLLGAMQATPDGYVMVNAVYHEPYTDTPEAVANHAARDSLSLAGAQHLGYGIWGSLEGHGDRYDLAGNQGAVTTAGWRANLRWSAEFDGILAGISYDGMGDYIVDNALLTGTAPTPYIPLSLRDREVHAGSVSLSGGLWDGLWFVAYGGYAADRYANQGGFGGASLRYNAAPGLDLELGMRYSEVSFTQGETGAETSAGLRLTMGFGTPFTDGFFGL